MYKFQRTIDTNLNFNGVGLHTGKPVNMTLKPAPENHGIIFYRTDLDQYIEASWKNVTNSKLCTLIENENKASVSTIEHIMAALYACKINNVLIEIDNQEVPILDGSSIQYALKINQHTKILLNTTQKYLKVLKEIKIDNDYSNVILKPSDDLNLSVEFSIEFDASIIGKQSGSYIITEKNFTKELADARTFIQLPEIKFLKESGLALGGSLDNAIVVDNDKVLNPNGLRYKDEFVRHKALDAVGDLSLCQYQIIGHFSGYKSSHALTTQLVQKLMKDSSNYTLLNINAENSLEKVS